MEAIVSEIRQDYPKAEVVYANYRDGIPASSGFAVEQFVSRGIFRPGLYKNPILAFDPV